MKWFFALNSASLNADRGQFYSRVFWQDMMLAAVASARQHTDLQPHLIWDGDEDPFLDVLREQGVTVVPHRVSFYDALAAHDPNPAWVAVASGAFLRTELALLEQDDLVLYTDCDVLFHGPFDIHEVPEHFACAPEFQRGARNEMNTGVMLMNLRSLRQTLPEFQSFIRANLPAFRTFDQDAYRQFYEGRADQLPDEYNWKPYWGANPDARIVHFHGPKPAWARQVLTGGLSPAAAAIPDFLELFSWNVQGYTYFIDAWTAAASGAGATLPEPLPPAPDLVGAYVAKASLENFTTEGYLRANADLRRVAADEDDWDARRHLLVCGLDEGRMTFVDEPGRTG